MFVKENPDIKKKTKTKKKCLIYFSECNFCMSRMDLFERVTEKMFKFKRQDFLKTNFASLMRIHVTQKYAPLKVHSNT